MRYIIFVIDEQSRSASGDEMAAIDAFNDSLRARGHWITAIGIGGPNTATVIDNRADAEVLSAGSLFETDDFYSGLWLIEAETSERAQQLALAASKACNRRVELRPLL
jgi:hypothetical protein